MVLNKHQIEAALHAEHQEISAGRLKEDNPLDTSENFRTLCEACRRGDLKICQEKITAGVNINARDKFDYTPLILASLCGHFEVVELLLESGALCERDTFQGERCLYNALNDRIRNLLLSYDYSKSRDPLQPLAAHITSLLTRDEPKTSDITLVAGHYEFHLHKFILSARSPYFAKKLAVTPETETWRVPDSMPSQSLEIAIRAIYLQEANFDLGPGVEAETVLAGAEKLGRQLELENLFDMLLEDNRRKIRQQRTEEIERGRDQIEKWFQRYIVQNEIRVRADSVDAIRWDRQNSIFADVLICADGESSATQEEPDTEQSSNYTNGQDALRPDTRPNGIPIGPLSRPSRSPSRTRERTKQATIIPAHRAMLLRADYFNAMFSSSFLEAQIGQHLPIIHIDCSPEVLRIVLTFLYTERADFGLDVAVEVLFAADLLFIEKLKVRAAMIISTLGNGSLSTVEAKGSRGDVDDTGAIDIYDIIRAGWDTRVPRLEEFGARYIANRLERYIDEAEFKMLVKESAGRIQQRQETDTVELIDDIRYYLSERFRMRFEDAGIDEMMEETALGGEMSIEGMDEKEDVKHANKTPTDAQSTVLQDSMGVVRTLDGELVGDEFAQDALNYQILLGKIDSLLESLELEA